MEDTWQGRELPVLDVLVRHFDDPTAGNVRTSALPAMTGFDADTVARAVAALSDADPPYLRPVKGGGWGGSSAPIALLGVTERARRETGQWPTPGALADRFAVAAAEAAESEPDPDRRSFLRALGVQAGGVMRDLVVDVMASVVTQQAGIG